MTFDGIMDLIRKLIDVLLVWMVLYYILKSLRKNVKMVMLFKGILFILVLKVIADILNLVTINFLITLLCGVLLHSLLFFSQKYVMF